MPILYPHHYSSQPVVLQQTGGNSACKEQGGTTQDNFDTQTHPSTTGTHLFVSLRPVQNTADNPPIALVCHSSTLDCVSVVVLRDQSGVGKRPHTLPELHRTLCCIVLDTHTPPPQPPPKPPTDLQCPKLHFAAQYCAMVTTAEPTHHTGHSPHVFDSQSSRRSAVLISGTRYKNIGGKHAKNMAK